MSAVLPRHEDYLGAPRAVAQKVGQWSLLPWVLLVLFAGIDQRTTMPNLTMAPRRSDRNLLLIFTRSTRRHRQHSAPTCLWLASAIHTHKIGTFVRRA